MKKLLKKLAFLLILFYISLITIGITYSDSLIFLPPEATYALSDNLTRISAVNSIDKNKDNIIVASYLKNPDAKFTILYSHGNAVDIGQLRHLQKKFYDHGYSIIIYDYSGYGLSEGTSSEQQVYNDVQAVYNFLINQQKLKPEQIISYGHSLGSAIATDLAFHNPLAGLVLENPFTTAFRVKTIYPLVPFDKFSNIDKIDKINTPLFITHSRDDPVIAFWHGVELFDKASEPKRSLWINKAGHSGITHTAIFWPELNRFVSDI